MSAAPLPLAAPKDYAALAALHRACYPTWPEYPWIWYGTHPTLILRARGKLIGSTSFSLSFPPALIPHNGEVCYGHGVSVHPDQRGKGLGWLLAEARHQTARDAGASFFVGMTWESNHAMLRVFERQGLKPHEHIIGAYPWHNAPDDVGILYVGSLR